MIRRTLLLVLALGVGAALPVYAEEAGLRSPRPPREALGIGGSCLSPDLLWWAVEDWDEERDEGGDARGALFDARRVVVDVTVSRPHVESVHGRLVTRSGRRARFAAVRTLGVVTSYDACLACDNSGGLRPSAVGNPVVESLREGLIVEVTPFVLAGGRRVALEVVVQAGAFDRPVGSVPTRAKYLGTLQQPVFRGLLVVATGATDGGTLDLELEGALGTTRVSLAPSVTPSVTSSVAAGEPSGPFDEGPHREHGFLRLLRGYGWGHPLGSVGSARVQFVEEAAPVVSRSYDLEVVLVADGEVLERVRLPALAHRTAAARVGRDRALIVDGDVEVG